MSRARSGTALTPELLERHDRPVPRYTSYPTAVEFHDGYDGAAHAEHLHRASERPDEPLSLYVHLPFCRRRCSFCACHVVVTSSQALTDTYLDAIVAEADLVTRHLGDRRRIAQLHWGGGTPTSYRPDELRALQSSLLDRFELLPGCEASIEIDPRVTTDEHLAALREVGFNRVSMGVQDVDAGVQRHIGRDQSWPETVDLVGVARRLGYRSINLDLVYGLPGQTAATFETTLDEVVRLLPDRIALYSFALVPWKATQQRRLWTDLLPSPEAKLALSVRAHEVLAAAGYRTIGMDHFALPTDELATAREEGRLSRTFMGYTAVRAPETIALGSSGISELASAYGQDHKRLASWFDAIEAESLPVERGVVLTEDDRIRRHVIRELLCNGRVTAGDLRATFGIELFERFEAEVAEMQGPGGVVTDGLAVVDDEGIAVTDLGLLLVRNVASVFDTYRRAPAPDQPVFSRSV